MLYFPVAELSSNPGVLKNYCDWSADGETNISSVSLALSNLGYNLVDLKEGIHLQESNPPRWCDCVIDMKICGNSLIPEGLGLFETDKIPQLLGNLMSQYTQPDNPKRL